MSGREIIVNTLVGMFLVSVFCLPFFFAAVVGEYVFHALDLVVQTFIPGLADSPDLFLAIFLVWSLFSGTWYLWKRRWMNAFLSFAIIPIILSIWLTSVHSGLGPGGFGVFTLFPILAIPNNSAPARFQIFSTAFIVSAVVAINTGLLGSGSLARIAANCILGCVFMWFANEVRKNWNTTKNPGTQAPFAPTRA
jgi:hypothetical protein